VAVVASFRYARSLHWRGFVAVV